MREVTVLAAGGTIAMTAAPGGPGARPALDGDALLAAVPPSARMPGLRARSVRALPSVHLTGADALAIARAALEETAAGRGVVVTSGTDTLEELAVLCDAVAPADGPPIVLTGSMRPAGAVGADGPANLVDAIAAARDTATAGLGGIVCFAGELHAARAVRKVDSTAPGAFASPRSGPLGRVVEGCVELDARPVRHAPIAVRHLDARVPVVGSWLGDDGAILRAALGLAPTGSCSRRSAAATSPPRSSPPCVTPPPVFPWR